VAVVGAGAVGLYYGARLAEAGHNVHFLMRRDFAACRTKGLVVHSPLGDVHLAPSVLQAHAHPSTIGPVDWVLVALKTYALPDLPGLLAPLLGPDTRLLAVMNGLDIEDAIVATGACPADRLVGALAFIGVTREDPGEVYHLGHGSLHVGHAEGNLAEAERACALFARSKVDVRTVPSLRTARWEKLCWNVPFNGLATALGGISVDRVVGDPLLRDVARAAMEETLDIARCDLDMRRCPQLDRETIIDHMFKLTDGLGAYFPSTSLDLLAGRRLEVDFLFTAVVRRARALRIPCPTVRLLTALIAAHSPHTPPGLTI